MRFVDFLNTRIKNLFLSPDRFNINFPLIWINSVHSVLIKPFEGVYPFFDCTKNIQVQ